jgi:hypothetical protein
VTPQAYLWLGVGTFVAGAVLWWMAAQTTRGHAWPPWVRRLGLALLSLGFATLAQTQSGLVWRVSSICFSVVAIVLLMLVLRDNLRR